ncbi:MAG: peptidase S41 [Fibrobacter sp.]|nr:peptidase S41 [Fibrobacter sp.]
MNNCTLHITHFFAAVFALFLAGCSDFLEPVKSTPEPTEYSYNYWLLQRTYLYEDELPQLDENGDSVSELYSKLSDRFTRYVPPSKSEETSIHINTSIVPGDVGMEYNVFPETEHPLTISRVYAESPAGRAKVPRYGNILNVNGVEITGDAAYATYDSVLSHSKEISMKVAYKGDTTLFKMTKEDVYAPTIFVDTLNETVVITITSFKLNTVNREEGTLGELKAYLDSTQNYSQPRLIDLRNNPGGHVNHCTAMADLFIESGDISTRFWRTFAPDGESIHRTETEVAKSGDAGEKSKFVALVNKNSASCAEIFAAAIQEGADIPIAGTATYGKGIGQSTWKTPAGALAIITNLEFLTPKGNSYNKVGVTPDYTCESATYQCGLDAIQKFYGKKSKKSSGSLLEAKKYLRQKTFTEGALLPGDDE